MDAVPTSSELKQICRTRKVRLTEQRLKTFEALRSAGKPTSAYDLLPVLEQRLGKRLAPLTVYRALDFLVEQGFVHKIASNHTFALCTHPDTDHESVYLVCVDCGNGEELAIGEIATALDAAAADRAFTPTRRIIELEGRCADCAA